MAKSTSKKAAAKKGATSSARGGGSSIKGSSTQQLKSSPKKAATSPASASKSGNNPGSRSGAKGAAPKSNASRNPLKNLFSAKDEQPMFDELFLNSLKDIYWAEKHLTKALPKMRKAATSPQLAQAFEEHTAQTVQQVARLEQIFELLGKKAQAKKCEAMDGLTKEAESMIEETEKGSKTRDVALILAAQKVEHYEIASYGGLATLAKNMQQVEIKNLLGQTLDEEKQTDELLTQLAENNINMEAQQEEGGDEENG